MRFATSYVLASVLAVCGSNTLASEGADAQILRQQIRANGFVPAAALYYNPDERLASAGKKIFESKALSLNGNISCKTCHLTEFGSADGIPLAAAIGGGNAEGPARALAGAKFLPRNTLAFWGRGAKGFNNFFWDGRVDFSGQQRISPFGSTTPSEDILVTVVHLPVVQIREMLDEDAFVRLHKKESVTGSEDVYLAIARNLQSKEPAASRELATALGKSVEQLRYLDYARAIASHIRSEFRIKTTALEEFVAKKRELSKEQVRGGIVFYGKGACNTCHSGPHFSDFKFHVVAFPQLGFGASGFGVDYGRYGATFKTTDLYKFRTPPLYNVAKTSPYGHSGSIAKLHDAVIVHFDPLRLVNVKEMTPLARHEFYKRLALGSATADRVGFLSDAEVNEVITFLGLLSF